MKLSKMTKEELELMSYTKIAKLYLEENKTTKNTADLFREVCNLLGLSEAEYQDKIADFFESLTTSKDFILLSDGNWDLKQNHKVKIDMDDIYEEKDDEIDEYESLEEIENEEERDTEPDDLDDLDDDYEDDDLSDLTIVDEEELDEE